MCCDGICSLLNVEQLQIGMKTTAILVTRRGCMCVTIPRSRPLKALQIPACSGFAQSVLQLHLQASNAPRVAGSTPVRGLAARRLLRLVEDDFDSAERAGLSTPVEPESVFVLRHEEWQLNDVQVISVC